jgi:N-acetylglucosaminyldiphosphoundecaprenol N-acetyl-beta-D-mannosaminyltransferase
LAWRRKVHFGGRVPVLGQLVKREGFADRDAAGSIAVVRPAPPAAGDALSRRVYCVLGMPIDLIDMPQALERIAAAAQRTAPHLVSTPNLNFLARSLQDPGFQESLVRSDLCLADGAPIVWLARLLGVPLVERVAGSDMFEALGATLRGQPLKVFYFGGPEGAADAACAATNAQAKGLVCVGACYPGHGTVEELSDEAYLREINASGAQLLVVALGAVKGQAWLLRNHDRVRVPVRTHLGATINFQAGLVRRAPASLRRLGIEWLWRIKEEPHLWRRYWRDGISLLRILAGRVLPLLLLNLGQRLGGTHDAPPLRCGVLHGDGDIAVRLSGFAIEGNIAIAAEAFRQALRQVETKRWINVDLSEVQGVDARFLGLLLIAKNEIERRNAKLKVVGAGPKIARQFQLSGAGALLVSERIA